jgi:hydrogenase expression/formation protein HypC
MCISVPARVIWKDKPSQASIPGRVRVTDGEREVDLIMVPEVSIGDYVVVHSGYAIDVIPRDRAVETIRLLGVEKST